KRIGISFGDDAWQENRRLTYLHDDDADRSWFTKLARSLQYSGWEIDRNQLRCFRHPKTQVKCSSWSREAPKPAVTTFICSEKKILHTARLRCPVRSGRDIRVTFDVPTKPIQSPF